MRLKCNHVKNLLSDYLDEILPENQTVAISQHLRHCQMCQCELESLKKTNQLLKLYIEKSPPDDYFQQLWPNLEYQIERGNIYKHISLQQLTTLLILKFKGFKANLLVKCEEVKTSLNNQWYKLLIKFAAVACFVLISIFIDRTYIRPPYKVASEFIRDSLYSQDTYPFEFFAHQKRNDNHKPKALVSGVNRMPVGYQVKDINLVKGKDRENIFNALPVLPGKVGTIDVDLHPVSFKDGILTLVANLSDVNDVPAEQPFMANRQSNLSSTKYFGEFKQLRLDSPKIPKVGSNKNPKFESRLANLLNDVTLPTLSMTDASGLENLATGKIAD